MARPRTGTALQTAAGWQPVLSHGKRRARLAAVALEAEALARSRAGSAELADVGATLDENRAPACSRRSWCSLMGR